MANTPEGFRLHFCLSASWVVKGIQILFSCCYIMKLWSCEAADSEALLHKLAVLGQCCCLGYGLHSAPAASAAPAAPAARLRFGIKGFPFLPEAGAWRTLTTTIETMRLLTGTQWGIRGNLQMSVLKSVWVQNLKSMRCQLKRLKHSKLRELKVTFKGYSSAKSARNMSYVLLELQSVSLCCDFTLEWRTALWWVSSSGALQSTQKETDSSSALRLGSFLMLL